MSTDQNSYFIFIDLEYFPQMHYFEVLVSETKRDDGEIILIRIKVNYWQLKI